MQYLGNWLCLEDKPKIFNFQKLNFFFLQNDECVHTIKKIVYLIVDDYEILLYLDFYILLVDIVKTKLNKLLLIDAYLFLPETESKQHVSITP